MLKGGPSRPSLALEGIALRLTERTRASATFMAALRLLSRSCFDAVNVPLILPRWCLERCGIAR